MAAKRIGFFDHAEQLGGAQKSLMELIGALDRKRFEPVLLCTEGAEWLGREELEGTAKAAVVRPSRVLQQRRDELAESVAGSGRHLLEGARPVVSLWRALRRLKIDLVHTNALKAHVLGGAAARLARLPLVWHVRDILEPGAALTWLRRAGRFAKPRVIAISEAVAGQFEGTGLDTTLIYNGIPLERFVPGSPPNGLREELGVCAEDEVICIVGRLTPWKGHRTLLEALAILAENRPRVKLIVLGEVAFWEASYGEELEAYADELGVGERVRWTGFREDVPDILRLSDVSALPSVDEPFGRAIVEAMAVGKPVVATRSGGAPEVVVDGETGILVEPRDAAGLASALARLLDDRELAQRMGERGMARARERFDLKRVARMVEELYGGML